jgi:hypothetical protein
MHQQRINTVLAPFFDFLFKSMLRFIDPVNVAGLEHSRTSDLTCEAGGLGYSCLPGVQFKSFKLVP